jgi:hypothetical protein
MKIIARSVFVAFFCLMLSNCTPGMFLKFKNETDEEINLKYSLCDDLISENIGKTFEYTMAKDETVDVIFSWNNLWNRGVTKEDYKNKETFLTIFENIEIVKLTNNERITKENLENYDLEYIKKGISGHIFILIVLDNTIEL